MLLATLALLPAALLFPGPAARGGSRSARRSRRTRSLVRGAWFGTADAPALLALVLAFALLTRRRFVWAAASLAAAVAAEAVRARRRALRRASCCDHARAAADAARAPQRRSPESFSLAFLPFLIADPGALCDDTVGYGAGTYRIVGYGLSNLLVNAGILDDRYGYYPFLPLALLIWLPLTVWLLLQPVARGGALAGRRRLHRVDVRADVPEPGLPELVPRLAADRDCARALARCCRARFSAACAALSLRQRTCVMNA